MFALSDYTCLHSGYLFFLVSVHGLLGSVPIRYPVKKMSKGAVNTHFALVSSGFPFLPLSSLESKVEPSSVELENSESLFLKTSDSDPALCPTLPPFICFSLPHSFSLFCLYLSFPLSPFVSPFPCSFFQCRKVEGRRRAKVTGVI